MPPANVSVDLQGALTSRVAACNAVGNLASSGPVFQLGLRASNRALQQVANATVQVIDSAAVFVALPIATEQRTTLLYVKVLSLSPLEIRLSFEVSAQFVVPLLGAMLLEVPADDRITVVEIQGQGQIEWLAGGSIV